MVATHGGIVLAPTCMQAGAIVEQGTHGDLYADRGSVYASLVQLQEQAAAADRSVPLLASADTALAFGPAVLVGDTSLGAVSAGVSRRRDSLAADSATQDILSAAAAWMGGPSLSLDEHQEEAELGTETRMYADAASLSVQSSLPTVQSNLPTMRSSAVDLTHNLSESGALPRSCVLPADGH